MLHFLGWLLRWESPAHCGQCSLELVILSVIREQAEQAIKSKPASSSLRSLHQFLSWVPALTSVDDGLQTVIWNKPFLSQVALVLMSCLTIDFGPKCKGIRSQSLWIIPDSVYEGLISFMNHRARRWVIPLSVLCKYNVFHKAASYKNISILELVPMQKVYIGKINYVRRKQWLSFWWPHLSWEKVVSVSSATKKYCTNIVS